MCFSKRNKRYYHIHRVTFWTFLGVMIILVIISFYRHKLYDAWLLSGGQETVTYAGVMSELSDDTQCYLCGDTDDSMMQYYRRFDGLGIIFLNDWNILPFETAVYDEDGVKIKNLSGTRSSTGTRNGYQYKTNSIPSKGIAEISVTLEEGYAPNIESIQKRLCQDCLNKILESLEFDRFKKQTKEAVPMCLVDFQTLEIYSLQETSKKIYTTDFYVKSYNQNNELQVEVIDSGIHDIN